MTTPSAKLSRRVYLQQGLSLGAVVFGLPLVGGCKKELTCTDTSALTAADMQTRTTLAYLDKSPNPAQQCEGCQQYKPANPGACGACTIVKGPINPAGYCRSWVKKSS